MALHQHPARAAGRHRMAGSGFTLVELMVTVAVMAILLGIAVPSYNDATLNSKLNSYANNLAASALAARSEAIKRNAAVTLCVSTDGATCATSGGWEQGWIVMCKTNGNNTCNAAGTSVLVLQREPAAMTGLKITETSGALRLLAFQPTGVGATSASMTVCRAVPLGTTKRTIDISSTGRPVITKASTAVCPTM
jgi:type IV fimbrial biogenesis protein FimT